MNIITYLFSSTLNINENYENILQKSIDTWTKN